MTRRPRTMSDDERRRETELDAIDDAFRDAFPWKKLNRQSGLALSAMPALARVKRFHLTVGAWWSALIIFGAKWGDSLEADNEYASPVAIGVLKATCPFNLDMRKIEPLIQLLGRYWLVDAKPDFDIARFIAEARASAQIQIEHGRATLEKVRRVRDVVAAEQGRGLVLIHDLGDGWRAVTINPAINEDLRAVTDTLRSADGVLFVVGSSDVWCALEAP